MGSRFCKVNLPISVNSFLINLLANFFVTEYINTSRWPRCNLGFLAKYQTETQQNEQSHIQESSLGEFNGGKDVLLFTRESAAMQVTFTFKKNDSTLRVTVPNNLKCISLHQYNVSHHLLEHDPLLQQIGESKWYLILII